MFLVSASSSYTQTHQTAALVWAAACSSRHTVAVTAMAPMSDRANQAGRREGGPGAQWERRGCCSWPLRSISDADVGVRSVYVRSVLSLTKHRCAAGHLAR